MKKILPFLFVTITLFPMQGDDLRLANPELYQSHLRAERKEDIKKLVRTFEDNVEKFEVLSSSGDIGVDILLTSIKTFLNNKFDDGRSYCPDKLLLRLQTIVAKKKPSMLRQNTLQTIQTLLAKNTPTKPKQRKRSLFSVSKETEEENMGSSQPKKTTSWLKRHNPFSKSKKSQKSREPQFAPSELYQSFNRLQKLFLQSLQCQTRKKISDLMLTRVVWGGRTLFLAEVIRDDKSFDAKSAASLRQKYFDAVQKQTIRVKKLAKDKEKVTIIIPTKQELVARISKKTGFSYQDLNQRTDIGDLFNWVQNNPEDIEELKSRRAEICKTILSEDLIQKLQQATGLSEYNILSFVPKIGQHEKAIADWIDELPIDSYTWRRFYRDVIGHLCRNKIHTELSPLFVPRLFRLQFDLDRITPQVLEAFKKRKIRERAQENPGIVQNIHFNANDSQQLQSDKAYLLMEAQRKLSSQINTADQNLQQVTNTFGLTGIGLRFSAGAICAWAGYNAIMRANRQPNSLLDMLGALITCTATPYFYYGLKTGIPKYIAYRKAKQEKANFEALYQHAQSELMKGNAHRQLALSKQRKPAQAQKNLKRKQEKAKQLAEQEELAKECSVCLDSLDEGKTITTQCKHTFHFACLNEWMKEKKSCPLCRGQL